MSKIKNTRKAERKRRFQSRCRDSRTADDRNSGRIRVGHGNRTERRADRTVCHRTQYSCAHCRKRRLHRVAEHNTQDTIFGGFAPNSSSAETLSKALGSRTVMSGSVSRSKNDPSQSLQTMNTLTPYPTKATVRSGMPTRRKFRTASSKNIRRSGKRKRLHRATLAAAVRHSRPAQRTSRREHSPRAKSEAATPSVPHRRKKKLLPT